MSRKLMLVICVWMGLPNLMATAGTLRAVSVPTTPVLDGVVDPVWQQAPELRVSVTPVARDVGQRYEMFDSSRQTAGREVVLKALVSDGRLFLLASWPDVTRSVVKKPWVWDEGRNTYVKGPGDEDRFALL